MTSRTRTAQPSIGQEGQREAPALADRRRQRRLRRARLRRRHHPRGGRSAPAAPKGSSTATSAASAVSCWRSWRARPRRCWTGSAPPCQTATTSGRTSSRPYCGPSESSGSTAISCASPSPRRPSTRSWATASPAESTISASVWSSRSCRRHREAGRIRRDIDLEAIAQAIAGFGFMLGFMGQVVIGMDREYAQRITVAFASVLARAISAEPPVEPQRTRRRRGDQQ